MKATIFFKKFFKAFIPYGILVIRRKLLYHEKLLFFYGRLKKDFIVNRLIKLNITPPPPHFQKTTLRKLFMAATSSLFL